MDSKEIYFTRADDGRGVSFEATLHMLDNNYFVFNLNIPFDRHLFRQKINVTGEWRKMCTSLCVD